jgi:glutamine synthetase
MVLSAAARRHGALASFSPKAEVDGFGSGAHHHLSLALGGQPLLSGGDGPHGMRPGGEAVIAGLVAALPELVGALSPSAP